MRSYKCVNIYRCTLRLLTHQLNYPFLWVSCHAPHFPFVFTTLWKCVIVKILYNYSNNGFIKCWYLKLVRYCILPTFIHANIISNNDLDNTLSIYWQIKNTIHRHPLPTQGYRRNRVRINKTEKEKCTTAWNWSGIKFNNHSTICDEDVAYKYIS